MFFEILNFKNQPNCSLYALYKCVFVLCIGSLSSLSSSFVLYLQVMSKTCNFQKKVLHHQIESAESRYENELAAYETIAVVSQSWI